MNNKVMKATLSAVRWSRRHLGALPAVVLGAAVGIVLYWGLAPARQVQVAGPATAARGRVTEEAAVWTCAMHPQIRQPKPGLCPICGMKLIAVTTGTQKGTVGPRTFTSSEDAKALMNIETAPVRRLFPTAEIRMVGKVDYDETHLAYITAWVPGRLDRLFVDYTGVPVRKGDHMVSLYSPELYSAQEELLGALQAVKNLQRSDIDIVRQTAESTVAAAREKLRLSGLTAEQVAQVEQRGTPEDHVTIYAPVSGIVIHKDALEGMYVQTGTRIYTLADLSSVWVKLDAYESDLAWLRYGQKVEFTSVSYPGETFTGMIAFIDPILNPITRTVKVRVNVPNPQGKLKPDMFVNAIVYSQVATGGKVLDVSLAGKWICPMHPEVVKDGPGDCDICGMPLVKAESLGYVSAAPTDQDKPLVIPVSAALVTGTRAIVYVEDPDAAQPTYEGRQIVLGPRAGDYYLVRRGLAEGERVVTRGNFKIDSALQIQAKPSMMTPEGGGAMAGHEHGGAREVAGAQAAGPIELPAAVRHQLEQVLAAAGKAQQAAQRDEVSIARAAFAELQQALQAVDMTLLEGHPHRVWMDLAMRLGNDAFEGKEAQTAAEVRRVGESLAANAASLRSQFSLGREAQAASAPAEVLPQAFRQQLAAVFARYFATAEALASDDAAQAVAALKDMVAAVEQVDASLLSGQARKAWTRHKVALEAALVHAGKVSTLQALRETFAPLSDEAASLARRFPPARRSAYWLLHCPVVFDGRGAIWLQQTQPVRNPYFGAAMPECGDVQEMIFGQEAPTSVPASSAVEHTHD